MKTNPQPLRCLIVEDSEDDAKLLARELRTGGYDVTAERVDTPEAMRAALERAPWDLVLSDFSMPRFSGLEALKLLQASGHELPFILVSGAMGEDTAVAAMRAGAHDYLLKHDLTRLGPAVGRELVNAAERGKRREMAQALRQSNEALDLAMTASNTGSWAFDLRTHVSTQSLIHDRMFGYAASVQGWTVETFLSHVLPEDRERTARTFSEVFSTEADLNFVCRIRRLDGEVRWIHAQGRHERDERGRAVRIAGLVNDITERKQTEAVDAFLSQAGVDSDGESFFSALARFLAGQLQMDYICIDRLEGDTLNATTLAVWHDGRFEDNLTYALKDTPCGEVVGKKVCCYPAHVIQTFPNDPALHELRAESYVGVTLFSHSGHPIGLIAVIGRQPLANRALAESTLARVAPRAAGELERSMVEAELKTSEERYRTLFSSMMDGFVLLEVLIGGQNRPGDLRFLEVNPAFEAQCGLRDPSGRIAREVLQLEEYWYEIFGQIALTGIPAQFEKELKALQRWFAVSAYRVGDPALRRIGVIFHDITERKRAELAMGERERSQRKLAEALALAQAVGGVGSWETNLLTRQVEWSEQTHRIFETTAATFTPTHQAFLDFTHPDDRAALEAAFNASTRDCSSDTIDHRIVLRDGRIKYVEERWETFCDETEAPVRAVGTCLDITERKQAENAIVQQLDELRRWQEVMLDREDRVQELKREVNRLGARLGESPKYPSQLDAAKH